MKIRRDQQSASNQSECKEFSDAAPNSVSTNVTSKNLEEHKFSLATRGFWGLPTGLDPFVSAGLAE